MTLPDFFKEAVLKQVQESQRARMESSNASEEIIAEVIDMLYRWDLEYMEAYSSVLALVWKKAFYAGIVQQTSVSMASAHPGKYPMVEETENPFLQENNDQ